MNECFLQVRDYHSEFYRPENMTVIITGQVKIDEVAKALEPLEKRILEKVISPQPSTPQYEINFTFPFLHCSQRSPNSYVHGRRQLNRWHNRRTCKFSIRRVTKTAV